MQSWKSLVRGGLALVCGLALVAGTVGRAGDAVTDSQSRLLNDIKYLASDELEGRGVGTKGLDTAADYIKAEFAKAGLKVDAVNGDAFQPFEMTIGAKLAEPNQLILNGPDGKRLELKLGEQFTPLSFGGAGKVAGELVFVGYGIDAPDLMYNDYEGIDVTGKIVVLMRREPQQGNPHSAFANPHGDVSRHAELRTKVSHAFGKGAAGVIFVDDPYSAREAISQRKEQLTKLGESVIEAAIALEAVPAGEAGPAEEARKKLKQTVERYQNTKKEIEAGETDLLMKFGYGGNESARSIPLLQITRAVCNELLQAALQTTLADIEKKIDADVKPQSAVITGWTAEGTVSIERTVAKVKNVIGVIEGEGPLADETIVIGAHYDHVGRGGAGSLAPGSNEIHNGADDNASGTVSLIELARRFAAQEKKPARRLVFIAFTAEELGLLGSAHYVKEPVYPLDKTVAMLNMDMVGRMQDNKLTVFGTKTAPHWEELLNKLNEKAELSLVFKPEGFGPSDHSSFYAVKIPVLHFFTNNHADYHRPGDDWEKINVPGMQRVVELLEQITQDTLARAERPQYVAVQGQAIPDRMGSRPYFGSIPDFGTDKPGYALSGVAPGSPAEKGGLKGGDRIIKIGMQKIDNLDDFDLALRKFSAGDEAEVIVIRGESEVKLKVTLEKPR